MSATATLRRTTATVRDLLSSSTTTTPRELAINAFVRETGAPRRLVTRFIDSVLVEVRVRKDQLVEVGRGSWHPGDQWLEEFHDAIFVRAMPDDTPAAAGSAHARLQDLISETAGCPVTLTHTTDLSDGLADCALLIEYLAIMIREVGPCRPKPYAI